VAVEDTGLEVSADKTMYMVMSRDQNAGRIHSIKILLKKLKISYTWE